MYNVKCRSLGFQHLIITNKKVKKKIAHLQAPTFLRNLIKIMAICHTVWKQ
jgi:hypothetical protein